MIRGVEGIAPLGDNARSSGAISAADHRRLRQVSETRPRRPQAPPAARRHPRRMGSLSPPLRYRALLTNFTMSALVSSGRAASTVPPRKRTPRSRDRFGVGRLSARNFSRSAESFDAAGASPAPPDFFEWPPSARAIGVRRVVRIFGAVSIPLLARRSAVQRINAGRACIAISRKSW